MNANEIVKALHNCKAYKTKGELQLAMLHAAELIESLQAQLTESHRRAQDARNELCLKCGRYREAHNGACDGCRWKE